MQTNEICKFLIIISLVKVLLAILRGVFWVSY